MNRPLIGFYSGIIGLSFFLSDGFPAIVRAAENPPEIFEIVVTAPRLTVQETVQPFRRGRVSMSYAVSYADLDLADPEERTELEERVRETAAEICELLTERYSDGRSGLTSCTREALRDAMEQVRVAIAAAH